MSWFFLGWLVCLSLVVGAGRYSQRIPKEMKLNEPKWVFEHPKDQKAEFLQSNRVMEIMKNDPNATIDSVLV